MAAPAQHRAHARGEFVQAEGLGDVVVGAQVEAAHAIGLGRPRREHDDGQAGGGRSAPHEPAHFDPVEARQVQVQDHQIWRPLGDTLQGDVTAGGNFGRHPAAALERVLDELGDVGFVLDDQDVRGGAARPGRVLRRA